MSKKWELGEFANLKGGRSLARKNELAILMWEGGG